MALMKCPECREQVSDQAAACPHCGCPIAETLNSRSSQSENHLANQKNDKLRSANGRRAKGPSSANQGATSTAERSVAPDADEPAGEESSEQQEIGKEGCGCLGCGFIVLLALATACVAELMGFKSLKIVDPGASSENQKVEQKAAREHDGSAPKEEKGESRGPQ